MTDSDSRQDTSPPSKITDSRLAGLLLVSLFTSLLLAFFVVGVIVGWSLSPLSEKKPTKEAVSKASETSSRDVVVPLEDRYFLVQRGRDYLLVRREGDRFSIDQVYSLKKAPQRYPKDPGTLALHGYYWDDVTRDTRQKLAEKKAVFRELAQYAHYKARYNNQAFALAEEIAELGGITFLFEYLKVDRSPRLRVAAAVSLGRRGYVEAIPSLLFFLDKEKNLERLQRLVGALEKLTELDLAPSGEKPDRNRVKEAVKTWWDKEKKRPQVGK